MLYRFEKMNMKFAKEIENWNYKGFMKTIYMAPYFDNFDEITKEMKGPGNCDGFVVVYKEQVIGLYEYYVNDGLIEVGLALNPGLVGKGLSKDFILEGIRFCVKQYNYKGKYIKLTVEAGNKSAYYAYLKAGFIEKGIENNEIVMLYNLK